MKVKGTLILDYVKIIRANRDRNWEQYLTAEDWEIINGQVLASSWYPYDCFRRTGQAVFKEIAGSNLDVTRAFGKTMMKELLQIYKNIVIPGDVVGSLKRHSALRRSFVDDDSGIEVLESGEDWARSLMRVPAPDRGAEYAHAFCHQVAGNLEQIIEEAGGKDPKTTIRPSGEGYEIKISWK